MRRTTVKNRIPVILPKPGTAFCLSLLAAGLLMQFAHAGEFAYGIGYVGEYSDNIRRVPVNPESEKISSTLMGIAYRENAPAFDAFLQAQAQSNHYRNDTYPDGPIYYADSSLFWRILPQQFTWFFIDRYDQVLGDPRRPNTPDNRIGTNVFYTGPDLLMRLGQVNTLVLGLRYGNTAYSDVLPGGADPRNNRYGAVARWQYAANTEMTYSLNYETEILKYDNEIRYGNLSRQDIFVQFDKRQTRARFLLDLGATRLDRDLAGVSTPESTGPLARLTWTQQLASATSAGVRLASEYLNVGRALLTTATSPTPTDGGFPATPVAGEPTTDYFYSKRAEVYYNRGDGNFDLNARINFSDIDYEIAPLDRKESGGRLDVTYKPSGLLSATLYGSHLNVQYLSPPAPRDDRNNVIGLSFSYRINMKLCASLDGRKNRRYSTIAAQEYTDRRLLFSLIYASSPLFAPRRR
jgi:hypothetical protein